jgi:cell division protein FtsB
MMLTKRFLLRLFFGLEVGIFTLLYLFGAQGLQALVRLRKENIHLSFQVTELEQEVKDLEITVVAWENDPYYKEKAARESLHMARKQDQVYLIG